MELGVVRTGWWPVAGLAACVLLSLGTGEAGEGEVLLEWNPNPEPDIAGYRVHYGTESRTYTEVVDVGNVTAAVLSGLEVGPTYHCVLTAYNTLGLESGFSRELVFEFDRQVEGCLVRAEAEAGELFEPMAVAAAGGGAGVGNWVEVAGGAQGGGTVLLEIEVAEAGEYAVWCRVRSATGAGPVFAVSLVGGEEAGTVVAGGEVAAGDWHWAVAEGAGEDGGDGRRLLLQLEAGSHLLQIDGLAAEAALDVVVLSSAAGFVPDDRMPREGPVVAFTGQPDARVSAVGGKVTLEARVAATGPVAFQWFKHGVAIPGATNRWLDLRGAREVDGGEYSVVVTSGEARVESAPVEVVVGVPVRLAGPPQRFADATGHHVRLPLAGDAGGSFHVQGSSDLANWETLSWQAGAPGELTADDPASATSRVRFYRLLAVADAVVIEQAPRGGLLMPGMAASLRVAATGNGPLAYQWLRDGAEIAGATGPVLALDALAAADAGSYSVQVTTGSASATSAPARVDVTGPGARITSFKRVAAGDESSIRLGIDGPPGRAVHVFASDDLVTWSWLADGAGASGTVTVDDPAAATAPRRFYQAAWEADKVSVLDPARHQAVVLGGAATLGVGFTANGPVAFQWLKDGVEIAGATGPELAVSDAASDDAGIYTVRVTNGTASATSQPITLVAALPDARINLLERFESEGRQFVRLGLDGHRGRIVHVFGSDDLAGWSLIAEKVNESGRLVFEDPAAAASPARFYRVAVSAATGVNPGK